MKKKELKQLKYNYEELEIKPSPDLWDRIELEADKTPVLKPKTSFQWWKYAAVVLLLIFFGSIFYLKINEKDHNSNIIAESDNQTETLQPKTHIESNVSKINTKQPEIAHLSDNSIENKTVKIIEERKPVEVIPDNPINNDPITAIKEKTAANDNFNKILVIEDKNINRFAEVPAIAERKKIKYVRADELLNDFDFKEDQNDQRRFGVINLKKIKGPSSFKALGMTIYSVDDN